MSCEQSKIEEMASLQKVPRGLTNDGLQSLLNNNIELLNWVISKLDSQEDPDLHLGNLSVLNRNLSHTDEISIKNSFQDLKSGDTVILPAGEIVQLVGMLNIPSGVTITTDPANPAVILMDRSVVYGLCVMGKDITIENVVIDFNMGGEWLPFRAAISFKFPGFRKEFPDSPIENIIIDNVTFINSTPPVERQSSQDSWAISFANHSEEPIKNIVVKNCNQLAKEIQLTANGNGLGILNLQILENYCEFGHANAIAVSSGVEGGIFENIIIARNELRQCTGIGVFVGVDGGKGSPSLIINNVQIFDNHIEMASDSPRFSMSILVRPGGDCEEINVFRNLIDTTRKDPLSSPRWFVMQGQEGFTVTYRLFDNILLGRGSNVIRNAQEL